MKKALLLSLSLMLMLMPNTAEVKPKESKIKEPNPITYSFAQARYSPMMVPTLMQLSYPEQVREETKANETAQESEVEIPTSAPQAKPIETEIGQEKEVKGKGKIFNVTAYTADVESTNKRKGNPEYGVTASGAIVQEHHTASCPRSMPFGTKLYIPDLETTYTCEDRGSKITEGHLDIYIKSYKEASDFGRRNLETYVLDKESQM